MKDFQCKIQESPREIGTHWLPNLRVSVAHMLKVIPTPGEEIRFYIHQLTIWLVRVMQFFLAALERSRVSQPGCRLLCGSGNRGMCRMLLAAALHSFSPSLTSLLLFFTLTSWACSSEIKHQHHNPCLRLCLYWGWPNSAGAGDPSSSFSSLADLCHFENYFFLGASVSPPPNEDIGTAADP